MQEEIVQRTENLAVNTTKLSARVLLKAIRWYLAHRKNKKLEKQAIANQPKHGKQTVKELIGQDAGVSTIDVAQTGLKDFQKVARKYGVDFAIVKDKTVDPPKYTVFFKSRDADALQRVVQEYSARELLRKQRPSVLAQLRKFTELVASLPKKVRQKTMEKER